MKKLSILLFVLLPMFILVGCEQSTQLRAASFSDISVEGSGVYGVGVKFQEDDRLEEKFVDVQVKTNSLVTVSLWEDNGQKYEYKFDKLDSWLSITSVFAEAQGKPGTENFEKYTQARARRYLFESEDSVELTFRVVVGDSVENEDKTGNVLVSTQQISDEFKLNIKGSGKEK